MSTDTEKRLAAALGARAEQVRPTDLAERPMPAPARDRRPFVVLAAAAACLVAVGAGVVVAGLDGEGRPAPAPAPEVIAPPDVGRDWPVSVTEDLELDLDGDGADDRVGFREELAGDPAGPVRLEVELSGGGSAYGVVELGGSYGTSPDWRIDADGDGDEELVLAAGDPDAMSTTPRVLDLRDDVLVEVPPAEAGDALLGGGSLPVAGAGTEDYEVDRAVEWWVEDGSLRSSTSVRGFASFGMERYVPDPYVADSWAWRIDADGVLSPEPDDQVCATGGGRERRACEPGEVDGVPAFGPVVEDTIGVGESFQADAAPRYGVALRRTADGPSLAFTGFPAGDVVTELPADDVPGVWPVTLGFAPDLASALYDADADGQPDTVLLLRASRRDASAVVLEGAEPPGAAGGSTTWVTEAGDVFTATGPEDAREVHQWAYDGDRLFVVPLGTFCFADGDPEGAERC